MNRATKETFIGDRRFGRFTAYVQLLTDTTRSDAVAYILTRVTERFMHVVALLLNPTCARKAQAEIDSVVGQTRLPAIEDEPALPYLKAMIKESMR